MQERCSEKREQREEREERESREREGEKRKRLHPGPQGCPQKEMQPQGEWRSPTLENYTSRYRTYASIQMRNNLRCTKACKKSLKDHNSSYTKKKSSDRESHSVKGRECQNKKEPTRTSPHPSHQPKKEAHPPQKTHMASTQAGGPRANSCQQLPR